MKLYSLLFENQINYFDSPFALVYAKKDHATIFVLYDASKYPENYIAAFVKVKQNDSNCPMAGQIAQAVRGEDYPGAGEAIYKIASTILAEPITSDRKMSTSPSAQKLWTKNRLRFEFQAHKTG